MTRLRALPILVALGLLTSTTAIAASWEIVQVNQKICVRQPSLPYAIVSYSVWVNGTWTRPLTLGIDGAPSGSTVWTNPPDPIPAGSSDGKYSLGTVSIQLPQATAAGTYNVSLYAKDGTTKSAYGQSFVVAPSSCRRY